MSKINQVLPTFLFPATQNLFEVNGILSKDETKEKYQLVETHPRSLQTEARKLSVNRLLVKSFTFQWVTQSYARFTHL